MQENNPVINTSPSESVYPSVTTPQPVYEKPKTNNFLVILLSVLLFVAVSIAGFFAYQTQMLVRELNISKDVGTSMSESTPAPVVTIDPTLGWEVYTNNKNGYSMKFPSSNYIRLECEGEELTATVRSENDKRESPVYVGECNRGGRYEVETKTYTSPQAEPKGDEYYKIDKKNVTIGGKLGNLYVYNFTNIEDGPYPKWYAVARVDNNGKTYEIFFGDKDNLDLFNQIISTFRFTN